MTKDDGGPAFPVLPPCDMEGASASGYPYPDAGMKLRDYFAAKAMAACIPHRRRHFETDNDDQKDWDDFFDLIAEESYLIADAMLEVRNE